MRSPKPAMLASLFAISTLAILPACSTTTVSSAKTDSVRVSCQSFEPIYWSAKDSAKTVAQVKEHNAAGKAICGWGKKSR